jgi:hypothetical protein
MIKLANINIKTEDLTIFFTGKSAGQGVSHQCGVSNIISGLIYKKGGDIYKRETKR